MWQSGRRVPLERGISHSPVWLVGPRSCWELEASSDQTGYHSKYSPSKCFRTLCCKGPPPPRPEYDVVCIGLTGSGKTSLLSRLCSEATDNIVPTTGFSIKAVPFQNAILNVKELGGADSIKKYWSRYYQGSQGVVFVLDSASSEEDLEVARMELHSALQHPQLCTLPFLILANQQDKPAARSVQEVT
ncbi:hypothetical protein cypCar_00010622 [Cyprinus carpio]|nr:hypothetical protein cypCar_00010622 [Cyprinus carpio]